jgi:hypothetical protein
MKTIEQHLNELPEPYRTKALKYIEPETTQTQSEALMDAFNWSDSKEGFHYWDKLYDRLKEQEQTEE